MTPAGLLFDFNGTLFLDNALNDAAWNQLAQLLRGFPFSEEEQRNFVRGKSNAAAVRRILGENTSEADCAKYSEQKEEIYLSLCTLDRVFQAQASSLWLRERRSFWNRPKSWAIPATSPPAPSLAMWITTFPPLA